MRINVSAWSIRRPVPAIVLFAVLMLLGVLSFKQLPVTRFPNIDIPIVSVKITQSGAAPAELETQVTKVVEDAVANIAGVKHITSTLTDGTSTTVLEFRLETDLDRALNDVKDAIATKRGDLPRTIDEPVIQRIDVEGQAILTYAATSPGMTLEQLSWHVDDVIKRRLQATKGVGRVERYGGVDREIRVNLDPEKLLAYGITAAQVNQQVRATNVDLGSGRGEVGGQEQAIRMLAGARQVRALADAKIILGGGREVRLKDLGRVVDDASEQRTFGRLNGQPVVSFSIFRMKGMSELSVADAVDKTLQELETAYPDVKLTKIDDAVAYTRGNYVAAMEALIEGAVLAVLVVLLFLRNMRATLISAIALPLAAIPTFWAMSAFGFSLNLVSLLGITLATGILVDDAIVEIENIVRHMHMGKSPYRAALEAADEIGLAVIAITLTIVAIFAPVSFMGGIAGQYFKQFGMTVAVAVLFSLLVARLITPMMAAYLMRPVPEKAHVDGPLMRFYTRFLAATLRWRYATLVSGVALFSAAIYATTLLPTGFLPDEDTSRVVVSVELPPGTQLDDTLGKTDQMVKTLRAIPEVSQVFVLGGTSPTGQLEVRRAALFVKLVPKTQRKLTQKQLKTIIAAKLSDIPDSRAWYVNERGERELSFSMLSRNGDDLNAAIGKVEAALRQVPGFRNVAAAGSTERPEIRVVPNLDEASRLGVAPDQISETIRVATIGDADFNLAKFTVGDRQIPIRVQLDETTRTEMKQIEQLRVTNVAGKAIPLTAVASVELRSWPGLDHALRPRAACRDRRRSRSWRALERGARTVPRGHRGPEAAAVSYAAAVRRCGNSRRSGERLHRRDGHWRPDRTRPAYPAVRKRVPAHHHSLVAAAVVWRRRIEPAHHRQSNQHACLYRPVDADGHRDQECDHARRLRDRRSRPWRRAPRGHHRRRPQAGTTDHYDDARDGCRHASQRLCAWRWRRISSPDGNRRDRRASRFDPAVAGLCPLVLHGNG